MKCMECVIVTLRLPRGSVDLELPAFMPVRELREKIVQTLRRMDPACYGAAQTLLLQCGGRTLPDERTLAACGVWDGAVLDGAIRQE